MGRGGMVLASFRWILVLKASGTEVPRACDLFMVSRICSSSIQGALIESAELFRSSDS